MSKCLYCNKRGVSLKLDQGGRCPRCAEYAQGAAEKRAEVRAHNLEVCRQHSAKENIQRIFDLFTAQYPDSLLTGISVLDDGDKLLLYLDDKPAYYATLDPLNNAVSLERYVHTSATSASSAPRSSRRWPLYVGITLLLVAVFGFLNSGRISKDDRPTPTATATAPANDIVSWATYYAEKYMPDDMALDTVETSISAAETYLTISCNMDVMYDSDDYLRSATELICKVCPAILNRGGYDHVSFLFYGPFVDKYGNDVHTLGISTMCSLEELQKINFDYFYSLRYTEPSAVITINGDYYIHPAYLD